MTFRDSNADDFERVLELYDSTDLEPYFNKMFRGEVVEIDGKVVAFAGLTKLVEATIVVDLSLPTRLRVVILNKFIERLKEESHKEGYDNVYAFTDKPQMEKALTEQLGWKEIKMLVLSTESKNGSGAT